MNTRQTLILTSALVCGALILAACAASPTSTAGNTTTAKATATAVPPTATPKPKPTSLPPITQAFCQSILTVDQANQIMHPSPLFTMILVVNAANGGQCTYASSPSLSGSVLGVRLGTYTGSRPISELQIETYFKQGLGQPGVVVLTSTPVSGVGDQAGIVVGSYTLNNVTVYGAAFFVLDGTVVFDCGSVYYSASPSAAQQGQLKQCAQHVVSVL